MIDSRFNDWLLTELDDRGWNQSDLARKSGMSPGHISHILAGTRKAGLDFYQGVGRALRVPLDEVLRQAGLIAPPAADDPLIETVLRRMYAIPPSQRQPLIDLLHSLLDIIEPLAAALPASPSPPHPLTLSPGQSSSSTSHLQTLPDSDSKIIPFLRKPQATEEDLSAWLDELPPEIVEELARSILDREDAERASPPAPRKRRRA